MTADDPNNDQLTHSMSGGDAAFSIDQETGQISTRTMLDREKRSTYRVTVTVEDPSGARDTHSPDHIEVDKRERTPGNHIWETRPPSTTRRTAGAAVAAYRAEDPEGKQDSLVPGRWRRSSRSLHDFDRGVLRFKNFAGPSRKKMEYAVAINASDGNADNTDTEDITIADNQRGREGHGFPRAGAEGGRPVDGYPHGPRRR